jgi:hypothetical protein
MRMLPKSYASLQRVIFEVTLSSGIAKSARPNHNLMVPCTDALTPPSYIYPITNQRYLKVHDLFMSFRKIHSRFCIVYSRLLMAYKNLGTNFPFVMTLQREKVCFLFLVSVCDSFDTWGNSTISVFRDM